MKFGNIGIIKIYFHHDLSISGLTVKLKVYGPQRKLSNSGAQTIVDSLSTASRDFENF